MMSWIRQNSDLQGGLFERLLWAVYFFYVQVQEDAVVPQVQGGGGLQSTTIIRHKADLFIGTV